MPSTRPTLLAQNFYISPSSIAQHAALAGFTGNPPNPGAKTSELASAAIFSAPRREIGFVLAEEVQGAFTFMLTFPLFLRIQSSFATTCWKTMA